MKTTTKTKQVKKAPSRSGRPVGSGRKDVPSPPYWTATSSTPKPESWTALDTLEKKSKKNNIDKTVTEVPKPLNYIKWDDEFVENEKSNDETIKNNNQVEKSNDINVKIDFSDLDKSIAWIIKAFLFVNVVLAIIIISFMIKYIF